jgi:hypothetical protein
VLEAVQRRLDANLSAMRVRGETVEHPFGTIAARMGATHFLMKRLPRVATEMALHVLAYNITRVLNIIGIEPMMAAVGRKAPRLWPLTGPKRKLSSAGACSLCRSSKSEKYARKRSLGELLKNGITSSCAPLLW